MSENDISTIRRFLGIIEGICISLPDQAQSLIYDNMALVDDIIDREEKRNASDADVRKKGGAV